MTARARSERDQARPHARSERDQARPRPRSGSTAPGAALALSGSRTQRTVSTIRYDPAIRSENGKPASKQELVYAQIRERILSGAYGPGYRLVIDRLAAELGVSALPVREAVRRLEAEGLVVFRPNAGAQVTPADPSLFEETMIVLAVLEGFATAQVAASPPDGLLEGLRADTEEMVRCMQTLDVLGFGRANARFHRRIHEACGNPALSELLDGIGRRLDAIRRTVFTHIPYRGLSSIEDHRRLIELIERRAPDAEIEAEARAHKLRTVEAFRQWRAAHDGANADAPAAERTELDGRVRPPRDTGANAARRRGKGASRGGARAPGASG
ncbi:MAG TPA: GntR family transcriptional regulator [Solirubrobacteraceae bacterium]|nr:GntR family transcriptional regulator [Solirubrobacteraceae bacterium]